MKLFLLGAMMAYTPALIVLAILLWRAQPIVETDGARRTEPVRFLRPVGRRVTQAGISHQS
jgi:hypothetical protein